MNSFLKALQQPEYVHVLVNHFPLTGLFVALLVLAVALLLKNRAGVFLGLLLVGVVSLSAWPVAEYGERGFDRVLAMADTDGQAYLQRHAELAHRWLFLFYVTAGASAAAMLVGWKRPKFLRAAALVVIALTLASLAAGAVIAENGGRIRHREFRYGPLPIVREKPLASAMRAVGIPAPRNPSQASGLLGEASSS